MSYVIEAEQLWKSYLLGSGAYRYQTFRDLVANGVSRLLGREPPREPRRTFWALQDISFQLKEGETLGVIGRNGAGKTTLFKVLSQISRPTKGRAVIRGRVGSLLEVGTGFHPELTGRENIQLNGAILGMSRPEVARKLDQIVEFAGLADFLETPVKRYSVGMRMRLAFSVAAHLEPEVMLIDEVLAVGDQEFQRRCLSRIAEISSEGRTVLFVSHNMGAVETVCSRVILLSEGRVVADGPTQEIVDTYHDMAAPAPISEEQISRGEFEAPTFYGWSLESSGSVGRYTIVSGSPCEFAFKLAIPHKVTDAYVGLLIYNSESVLTAAFSSYDIDERCMDLEEGIHEVTFSVPSFPAGRGHYYMKIALNDNKTRRRLATWQVHPEFEVLRGRESVQIPPPLEGVIALPARFLVRPASEAEAASSGVDLGSTPQQQ